MNTPRHFATTQGGGLGRVLPHSLEAEEYLLSCCLLDGADMVSRCLEARIKPSSFYDPKHGIVYERLIDLHHRHAPIDVAIVAEELKASQQLDQIGGYAFLTQVSSRIPTTAQAGYFIAKVREQAILREIIRSATGVVEDCYGFSGDIDGFAATVRARIDGVAEGRRDRAHEMPWDDLLSFDPKADADCLMGNRYLGRSGAVVIVAQSGVGKSVLALQFAACAALGRPFFGLRIRAPLRVLYVQAEDDRGDVAESVKGFIDGNGVGPADVVQLREKLRIVRWNDAAGDVFIERLRTEHRRHPFDLVIINPLFSFAGCNVSDQKELSPLLRNKLQPILNETGAAAVVVHHTNKPPTKTDDKKGDLEEELRYAGSGSAELTNWARAYIVLKRVPAAPGDVYAMTFVKRGKRAGIIDENGQITTKVMIEHSKRGLCWLPSDYHPDGKGACQQKFSYLEAFKTYDASLSWSANEARIAKQQNVSTRTVRNYRDRLEMDGRKSRTASKSGLETLEAA